MKSRNWFALSLLVIVGLLLASCAPAVAPTEAPVAETPAPKPAAPSPTAKAAAPTPTPKAVVQQPQYGGVLTISHAGDPITLDMQQEASYLVSNVVQAAYSGITQFNPSGPEEVIGDLAKNWELSPDGKTYTFRLNENVKFHDGSVFTAEDARFSFERMINPPKGILAPRRADLSTINKVEALDKDTVKFILKYPSAPFLDVISSGFMVIYSKAFVEKKGHMKYDVMGTGPYKFKRYSTGISLEYVKNVDYFVKGRPYVDGITFYIIKDAGTRLAAFRTGQVKLTGPGDSGLTAAGAELIKQTLPQATVIPYPSLCNANFLMNVLERPWTDIRVRKAMDLAIDRQKAISVLGQGYGELGSNIPGKLGIPKEELLKMPGWRQPKDADIAEAKKLLAEAGYRDGFTVKTLVRAQKATEDLGVYVADQLARIGVKIELDVKESAVRTNMLNQGTFNSTATQNCFAYSDPENVGRLWAPPEGADWGMNWARYNDGIIWDLFDKQSRALDPTERKRIVRELDLRMIEAAVRPVVYWRQDIIGAWPEVKNRGVPVGTHSFQKYQDIWLAK